MNYQDQFSVVNLDLVNVIALTLSLPVTGICVNFSTVYNDTLVAKGLNKKQYG